MKIHISPNCLAILRLLFGIKIQAIRLVSALLLRPPYYFIVWSEKKKKKTRKPFIGSRIDKKLIFVHCSAALDLKL